jgi:hypothetical protein
LAAAGVAMAIILERIGENSTTLLEICQCPRSEGWFLGQIEWRRVRLQISRAIAALMAREAIPREPTPPAVDALPDGPQPALTQLSQSEFCRISGMNESTLSKKLKAGGFGPLTIEHARKIKTDTDGRKRKNQTPESDEEVEKKFQQNSR